MTVIVINNGITEAYTNDLRAFTADVVAAETAKRNGTAILYEMERPKLNGVIKQIERKRK